METSIIITFLTSPNDCTPIFLVAGSIGKRFGFSEYLRTAWERATSFKLIQTCRTRWTSVCVWVCAKSVFLGISRLLHQTESYNDSEMLIQSGFVGGQPFLAEEGWFKNQSVLMSSVWGYNISKSQCSQVHPHSSLNCDKIIPHLIWGTKSCTVELKVAEMSRSFCFFHHCPLVYSEDGPGPPNSPTGGSLSTYHLVFRTLMGIFKGRTPACPHLFPAGNRWRSQGL